MIMQKAAELAQALVESDEFKAYNLAKEAVENDKEATRLMMGYSKKEEQLQMVMSADPTDIETIDSINQELEDIRMQIVDNAALENLAEAQGGFQFLMGKVNEVIGQYINPKRAESASCGSSCDSCAGCH